MERSSENDVVTMLDVLAEEKEIDEASSAVLAGSDETKCTYSSGYVKRQALYSCLTCQPSAKTSPSNAIGLCLACSLVCHDNHELIELYTKRGFKCDCGVKDGSVACQLDSAKKIGKESSCSSSSDGNKYNQNFSGTYCICHRPYPDEEDSINDEMIQCIICEDWYHGRHLNAKIPDSNVYSEMICGSCMKENNFLNDYIGMAVEVVDEASRNESNLNVTSLDESDIAVDCEPSSKKIKLSEDACSRPKITLSNESEDKATFWKDEWREKLCKCPICLKMYGEKNVLYLLDSEDTVHHYEEKGKNKPKTSTYETSLAALSNLPRVNQIDAITSYNRMKDKLFEFLQTFVVNNQIVTEDDIKKFFSSMKQSNENVHQPHFCR